MDELCKNTSPQALRALVIRLASEKRDAAAQATFEAAIRELARRGESQIPDEAEESLIRGSR